MQKTGLFFIMALLSAGMTFAQPTFTLSSKDLGGSFTKKNEFKGFGCDGGNVSPQLSWTNAPEGTKSFAITCYDPDAPTGSGWWHWVVFDMPASATEIVAGAGNPQLNLVPGGAIQSLTSYGGKGFGGPCPPPGHGFHRYIFTVYALKTAKLGLDANAVPEVAGYYLWQNAIGKASIVAYYKR